jgi:DNA-binding NtrC family response regulator
MKKKVLVVDDDIDYLMQLRIQLQALGFDVLTAEGTASAMAVFQREKPDMAIVDLMMERSDSGFTLCYHFKKEDETFPIILISCVTRMTGIDFDTATEEERSWIKADAMLGKPIRFEQLQKEINRLLNDRAHTENITSQ